MQVFNFSLIFSIFIFSLISEKQPRDVEILKAIHHYRCYYYYYNYHYFVFWSYQKTQTSTKLQIDDKTRSSLNVHIKCEKDSERKKIH